MKNSAAVICGLLLPLSAFIPAGNAEEPKPVFHLSFENGLSPDIGSAEACKLLQVGTGEATPLFYEHGLSGKALLISEDPKSAGYMAIPKEIVEKIKASGTILFWVRGLENWNLWSVGGGGAGAWATFLSMGGGQIYKWEWYGGICLFGHGPSIFYPNFDQYQWTQLGVSWQSEGDGKSRNRIYLDGRMVGETTGTMNLDGLRFGSHATAKGARHLLDELKIYDRVLSESDIIRIYRKDMCLINSPAVSVPRLKASPAIDGKVNDEEWAGAAEISGMIDYAAGEQAEDQSAFYLGYDDKYLYVAMKGEMTEKARSNPAFYLEKFLRPGTSGRDEKKIEDDDAVEIVVSPEFWKTEDHRKPASWKEYRLMANAVGGYGACSFGSDGTNPKWEVKWETASTATSAGWQFESRIPFDSFGVKTPAPGDRWGLQLGRIWKHLKDEYDVWCWGARTLAGEAVSAQRRGPFSQKDPPIPEQPDPVQSLYLHCATKNPFSPMGLMEFAGSDTPTIQVEGIGRLADRKIDFQSEIFNPSAAEQNVKIKLFTDTDELRCEDTLTIPAGGKKELGKKHEINNPATSCLTLEVSDKDGRPLHRTAVPFHIEQVFNVRVIQYPNYERLLLELELGAFSEVPLKDIAVDLSLVDSTGKGLLEKKGMGVDAHLTKMEVDAKGIAPGEYTVTVAVRSGEKLLVRTEKKINMSSKAPWWNNRYGFEDMDNDMVPYPWSDMKLEDGKIKVWGRDYCFGKGLFPDQITTLERPILRAPIRLLVKTADGAVLDTAAAEAKDAWTKKSHTRIEGTRAVDAGAFSLENSFWAEYDGLLWNTLTFTPKQKISVASMELEIQLTKEFTDVVNAPGILVGKLKQEGITGGTGVVWLGNGDGGLQWLSGDDKWYVKEPQKTMRVEVGPEGATLRQTIIDVTADVDKPYDIQFGLIATPVRPKTWRTPEHPSCRGWQIGGGPWFPQGLEFMPAADPGTDFYCGSLGGRIYVHTAPVNTGSDASGTEDFKVYGNEWLENPNQRPSPGEKLISTTTESKSYRDYFVWRHWRYQQKYRFNGLYYDNPNRSTLGTREVMKRLYNVALLDHRYAARDHIIGMASNGYINMGYMGFVIYHWDGEHLNSAINDRQPTYKGLIDPDVFRAEYMGHNFGWTVMFLGQARLSRKNVEANGGPEAVIDHLQGLELLHDCPPGTWHIEGTMDQVCSRAVNAYQRLNLRHWIYQFVPYWRQEIVKLPNEDMLASFYIARPSQLKAGDAINGWYHNQQFQNYFDKFLPSYMKLNAFQETEAVRKELEKTNDKAVMIVYNNSDFNGEMRLRPDWQKLGLGAPEGLKAENAVHSTGFRIEKAKNEKGKEVEKGAFFPRPEEYARIEADEIVFPMTKWNYRMIVLEKK